MSKGIRISKKHGLNPSIAHFQCCGKEIGVAILGHLKGDAEAPRDIAMGLCDRCEGVINQGGVMIIEVRDGERGPNPYRTGRLVGCSQQFNERMGITSPIAYMEQTMFSDMFNEYLNNQPNQ